MGLCKRIKEMPSWKLGVGLGVLFAAQMGILTCPKVHVGRESKGLDIRRYSTWMFTTPEPIVAEVRKGEYHAQPLLGQYSLEPSINETITSSRVYRGGNGEFIYVSTDDWGRDGEQDTLKVIVTTGERSRDNRRVLYGRGWEKEKIKGELVLFSDSYHGPLTEQEAVAISPDLKKFSDEQGMIDAEKLAVGAREEAYRLTKAEEDQRFKIRD